MASLADCNNPRHEAHYYEVESPGGCRYAGYDPREAAKAFRSAGFDGHVAAAAITATVPVHCAEETKRVDKMARKGPEGE